MRRPVLGFNPVHSRKVKSVTGLAINTLLKQVAVVKCTCLFSLLGMVFRLSLSLLVCFSLLLSGFSSVFAQKPSIKAESLILKYTELEALAKASVTAEEDDALQWKVDQLLQTPFLYPKSALKPVQLLEDDYGRQTLRIASWNIERGKAFEKIIGILDPSQQTAQDAQLSDEEALIAFNKKAEEQREWLQKAHIFLLTELDWGMRRSDYRNVAKELSDRLGLHAAFATEFLELSPFMYDVKLAQERRRENLKVVLGESGNVSPSQYKGIHGSAILSRYPILSTDIIRLPDCYNWYDAEKDKITGLERVRRFAGKAVFEEVIMTEVRKGGRFALVADLAVPEATNGQLTVAVAHLENRTKSKCRNRQLQALLERVKHKKGTVVIGGDFNTSGKDVSPTSVVKEVRNRVTDPTFWLKRGISVATIYAIPITATIDTIGFLKNFHNPAASNVPVLFKNPERQFFKTINNFTFDDGGMFDTRGDMEHSFYRDGYFSNSNERGHYGFGITFQLERPLAGIWGHYKLDWLMVKPGHFFNGSAQAKEQYRFSPLNGRTMRALGEQSDVSDHFPLTVDIMMNGLAGPMPTS